MRAWMSLGAAAILVLVCLRPAHADADGAKDWKAKCQACHGPDGKGKTKQGEKMGIGDITTKEWQATFTDAKITETIEKGLNRKSKDGKVQKMTALKGKLTPEQIKALIAHLRKLAK